MQRENYQPWTSAEEVLLRQAYPQGMPAARQALPHRSAEQIRRKAYRMGVHVDKAKQARRNLPPLAECYSQAEDRLIQQAYAQAKNSDWMAYAVRLLKSKGMGRTRCSVRARARRLGLLGTTRSVEGSRRWIETDEYKAALEVNRTAIQKPWR